MNKFFTYSITFLLVFSGCMSSRNNNNSSQASSNLIEDDYFIESEEQIDTFESCWDTYDIFQRHGLIIDESDPCNKFEKEIQEKEKVERDKCNNGNITAENFERCIFYKYEYCENMLNDNSSSITISNEQLESCLIYFTYKQSEEIYYDMPSEDHISDTVYNAVSDFCVSY